MNGYLGVVDFGIGGLSVYKKLKEMSDIPVLYYADSGHTPYGQTEPSVLRERLDRIFEYLFRQGASDIVIAGNAASAVYDNTDQVTGIIEDGVTAIEKGGWRKVGLIAGRGTVESGTFAKRFAGHPIDLTERIAQPLSAHIEAGRLDGAELHSDLQDILAPLKNMEAVLLACTHYPAIAPAIARYLSSDCVLVDPAQEMASRAISDWGDSTTTVAKPGRASSGDRFFTSGDPAQFQTSGGKAFAMELPLPDVVPL